MGDVDALLLDLDGTLIDPAPGIRPALDEACRAVGAPLVGEAELRRLVGPPLQDALPRALGLDRAAGEAAVAAFRRAYSVAGLERYRVYDGIRELLAMLRNEGLALVVATSKPEPFALRLLEHAGLLASLGAVHGARFDGSIRHKADIVAAALAGGPPRHSVMLGDREQDVAGAAACGVNCIGAGWGYGAPGELQAAGALAVAGHPAELPALLGLG